ncbi:hypothetical protein H7I76_17660, partial [Mycolicibacterium vaccae]|nr:hypothetical protein [Mycolicibacterium vaccae]
RSRSVAVPPIRWPATVRGIHDPADAMTRRRHVHPRRRRRRSRTLAILLSAPSSAARPSEVAAALARDETRGCHHRAEYPDAAPEYARSIVVRLCEEENTVHAEAPAAVC